ncbi:mannitol dehydrogenase family protein [Shewanella electrodiphila]|uniref:Mannitol dehydrogenase family protein n=1 Tax=Shewanella electrodiphila TaxID=934143 RepID=A0ABT0KMP0_9GAMM|nr:mannitol dehydrogenase family protein [Shewanella electrodiphila]
MNSLSLKSLNKLAQAEQSVPNYRMGDKQPKIGIVHIGPGAFFRGHQAWYTHQAMKLAGGNWGISCVSMRSAGVAEALNPQNGLFTLAVLDAEPSYEVVGSIQEVIVATQQYQRVMDRLSHEDTQFVTMTITEKGYCLDSEGLLAREHVDIQQDLTTQANAISAVGLLSQALMLRFDKGLAPLTILSCDNLTDNGKKLRQAIISFSTIKYPQMVQWLSTQLICPCSMVDSITPATDDSLKSQVKQALNVTDNWPIKREAFIQWVIEDCLPSKRPAWELAGATFTKDVRGFEHAKLRLLNCPHSTLAYLGVLLDVETVFDGMQIPKVVELLENLVKEEVIPSFTAPAEMDVVAYKNDIFDRFRNPAIRHLVAQIAWDGSQKLPMRILPIIEKNIVENRSIKNLTMAVVAWFMFVRKRYQQQVELVDPLADKLLTVASQCNNQAQHDITLLMTISEVFSAELSQQPVFIKNLQNNYQQLLPLLTGDKTAWA